MTASASRGTSDATTPLPVHPVSQLQVSQLQATPVMKPDSAARDHPEGVNHRVACDAAHMSPTAAIHFPGIGREYEAPRAPSPGPAVVEFAE